MRLPFYVSERRDEESMGIEQSMNGSANKSSAFAFKSSTPPPSSKMFQVDCECGVMWGSNKMGFSKFFAHLKLEEGGRKGQLMLQRVSNKAFLSWFFRHCRPPPLLSFDV